MRFFIPFQLWLLLRFSFVLDRYRFFRRFVGVNLYALRLERLSRSLSLLVIFLLASVLLNAQTVRNVTVNGVIVDSANNAPIGYTTIALMKLDPKKIIDGTIADEQGKFHVSGLSEGQYALIVSFLGFRTDTTQFVVPAKSNAIDLGKIFLVSKANILDEVVVESNKPIIEDRVDRIVYNAEHDLSSKGGDARDLLRKVPMLSVDIDGNVSLRGSTSVTVLINNKPSSIFAINVADAIKQIPSDQIRRVEVITAPSSKYDAEGSSGIINIITKKNIMEGLLLGVDVAMGNRASNLGLNGTFRKKRFGFTLGGWGRRNYNTRGQYENNQVTRSSAGNQTTHQTARVRTEGLLANYNLGFDYDISDKTFITASVRVGALSSTNWQKNLRTTSSIGNSVSSMTLQNTRAADISNNIGINLAYGRLYSKPQKEFSFQVLFTRNNRNNDFENDIVEHWNYPGADRIKNLNNSYNSELTCQLDYQAPVTENQIVEIGAKHITRKLVSYFTLLQAFGDGEYEKNINPALTNVLDYNQGIAAGYASYTYTGTNGVSLRGGVRYEHAMIAAFEKQNIEVDIPSYGVIVPSISAMKRLKSGDTFKFSYNRRIQRPSIAFLNPNRQAVNPLNITYGNPVLQPEYTNVYEVGYSTLVEQTTVNVVGFVRSTQGGIHRITDLKEGGAMSAPDTVRTTFKNIGTERTYGVNIFANVNVGKFSFNGGGDLFYVNLNNNVSDNLFRSQNEGWVMKGRFFATYMINKGWSATLLTLFNGRTLLLQGFKEEFRIYTLLLRKEFAEQRGNVGIGVENFLTPTLRLDTETQSPMLSQHSQTSLHNFNFRINFSYRIGSVGPPKKKRRSINNDDLKDVGNVTSDAPIMQPSPLPRPQGKGPSPK